MTRADNVAYSSAEMRADDRSQSRDRWSARLELDNARVLCPSNAEYRVNAFCKSGESLFVAVKSKCRASRL